jgi:hypothetical protein
MGSNARRFGETCHTFMVFIWLLWSLRTTRCGSKYDHTVHQPNRQRDTGFSLFSSVFTGKFRDSISARPQAFPSKFSQFIVYQASHLMTLDFLAIESVSTRKIISVYCHDRQCVHFYLSSSIYGLDGIGSIWLMIGTSGRLLWSR